MSIKQVYSLFNVAMEYTNSTADLFIFYDRRWFRKVRCLEDSYGNLRIGNKQEKKLSNAMWKGRNKKILIFLQINR